jgi:hypothetical protein
MRAGILCSVVTLAGALVCSLASLGGCGKSYKRIAEPMPGSAAILPSPVLAEEVPTSEPSASQTSMPLIAGVTPSQSVTAAPTPTPKPAPTFKPMPAATPTTPKPVVTMTAPPPTATPKPPIAPPPPPPPTVSATASAVPKQW